jgi:dihydroorotase-like cyclic amidohydrolase
MEVGEPARLALISTKGKTSVAPAKWISRGKNTPFFHTEMNGAIVSLID